MAIASKIRDGEVVVVDRLEFDKPETRRMASVLSALGLKGVSTLVTVEAQNSNAYKSARNITGVSMLPVADLNALSVLGPHRMLITKAALDVIKERSSSKTEVA